jgi:glycosyltransferase involved in cell wall biosynthesis
VESDALPHFYGAMDIGISPALFDPCPNSVIEMLASGLPVITTRASGAAELVPGSAFMVAEDVKLGYMEFHNFRRLPSVDVVAWCDAIDRVLSSRAALAEECLEHARQRFDIERIADRYEEFIREIAE